MVILNPHAQLDREAGQQDFEAYDRQQARLDEMLGLVAVSGSSLADHILDGEEDIPENERNIIKGIN